MASIWFYNIPFHGHINPTLRLMRELVQRGDHVTYFSTPPFKERVEATGAVYRSYQRLDAFEGSREVAHAIHLGGLVAGATHALLPEVLASVERERPELLMYDMSAPWGGIASRRFDIPAVACFPHLPFYWRTILGDEHLLRKGLQSIRPGYGYWRELRRKTARIARDYHLRSANDFNVLSSSAELNIVFATRYFQPHEKHFDKSYLYVGPEIETERHEEPLALSIGEDQKLIYIAVGTVYQASVHFLKKCIVAFNDQRYAVVMSIGRSLDPNDLGTIPQNFTVRGYVPQLSVLQEADVFITHGGMNSINEAVYYGVPMIVVPNTIEQAINAARIEDLGAGMYLEPDRLSVKDLQTAALSVMSDLEYVRGLERIKKSFSQAGGASRAADAISSFKEKHGLL